MEDNQYKPRNADQTIAGFLYSHTRINENTQKILQNSSFLYALIEILKEKGIISIEELDEKKKVIAGRLVQRFTKSGNGLLYMDPEIDKYTFDKTADVPCFEKLDVCKAICCKLPFALSRQDWKQVS